MTTATTATYPPRQHWTVEGFRVGILIYRSNRRLRCDDCGQPGAIHWVHAEGKGELEGFTASAHFCDEHRPARGILPGLDYTRWRWHGDLREREHLRQVAALSCGTCGGHAISEFTRICHGCGDPARWRDDVSRIISLDGERTETRRVHDQHETGRWARCLDHREELQTPGRGNDTERKTT
jgi:hypothetical protein